MPESTHQIELGDRKYRVDYTEITDAPVIPDTPPNQGGTILKIRWVDTQNPLATAFEALRERPVEIDMSGLDAQMTLSLATKPESVHPLVIQNGNLGRIVCQNSAHRTINKLVLADLNLRAGNHKALSLCGNDVLVDRCKLEHLSSATEGPCLLLVPTADDNHGGSSAWSPPVSGVTISSSEILNTWGEAIYLGGGGADGNGLPHSDILVENCVIRQPGVRGGQGDAIDVKRNRNVTIRRCRIYDMRNGGRAIVTQGITGQLLIEDIRIIRCRCDGQAISISNTWGRTTDAIIRGVIATDLELTGTEPHVVTVYAADKARVEGIAQNGSTYGTVRYHDVGTIDSNDPDPDPTPEPEEPGGSEPSMPNVGGTTTVVESAVQLMNARANPGDSIVITRPLEHAGTVRLSNLRGTPGAPIVIRPSERGSSLLNLGGPVNDRQAGPVLLVDETCTHVDLNDIWVDGGANQRVTLGTGNFPSSDSNIPVSGIQVRGRSIRVYRCTFTDSLTGAACWGGTGVEFIGCTMMNNGVQTPARNGGHGAYGNSFDVNSPLVFRHCLFLGNFGLPMQFYTQSGMLKSIHLIENLFLPGGDQAVVIGGTGSAGIEQAVIRGNVFIETHAILGYAARNNGALVFMDNFIYQNEDRNIGPALQLRFWDSAELSGNYVDHGNRAAIRIESATEQHQAGVRCGRNRFHGRFVTKGLQNATLTAEQFTARTGYLEDESIPSTVERHWDVGNNQMIHISFDKPIEQHLARFASSVNAFDPTWNDGPRIQPRIPVNQRDWLRSTSWFDETFPGLQVRLSRP